MRVTLFDYGAGNLHSLAKALYAPGVELRVEEDPLRALDTGLLVLPGVGAFGAAAARLAPGREAMRDAVAHGLPCLGICLGMQLLFEASEEGEGRGLGLFPGRVTRLRAPRAPHRLERRGGGRRAGRRGSTPCTSRTATSAAPRSRTWSGLDHPRGGSLPSLGAARKAARRAVPSGEELGRRSEVRAVVPP